jgi:hypothetical protein
MIKFKFSTHVLHARETFAYAFTELALTMNEISGRFHIKFSKKTTRNIGNKSTNIRFKDKDNKKSSFGVHFQAVKFKIRLEISLIIVVLLY